MGAKGVPYLEVVPVTKCQHIVKFSLPNSRTDFVLNPFWGGTVVINLPRIVRAISNLRVVVVW